MKARALSLGIRGWLVLLVAVAVVPGGLLLARGSGAHRSMLTEDVAKGLRRTAALAADRVSATVERAHGVLSALAAIPELGARDGRRCSEIARRIIHAETGFLNISVADEEGKIYCSAVPATSEVHVGDREYFRRAMRSDDLVVGRFAIGRIVARPVLHVAHPVLDERRRRVGVAFAALDVRHLDGLLASVASTTAEVVTIVDGEGTVVARHPEPESWVGSKHHVPLVQRMLAADDGFAEVAGLDGVVRMYAFAAVRGASAPTDLRVSAGVEREIALAPVDRVARRGMAVYALAVMLGILAAWVLGEFALSRRLERIRLAARRLTAGDLRARSGVAAGSDGVGGLARAFDEMAASIEALTLENRRILECVGVGIYGVDGSGIVTFVNPAAAELLGYSSPELLGMPAHELFHAPAFSSAPAGSCPLLVAVRDGSVHRYDGLFFRRRDGRTFPVDVVSTPVRHDGQLVGAVVTFRDVTDRNQLEQQLRHAQKMEAVGRLAGGVAHDFNNLLTVILSAGHSIASTESFDPAAVRSDAQEVLTAASRAAALTKQLLAFSRSQPVAVAVVEVNAVVTGSHRLLERVLGEDVETALSLAASGRVRIDPGQLEQVLMNLAVNARDAMPDGGKLTIETADVVLDDTFRRGRLGVPAGRYVMVAVSDTGTGMDEDTLSQIFEPFYTTKPPGKGTGLGLSTVWGIVKQNGGDIHVYSALGMGTTFKVYLPVIEADAAVAAPSPPLGDLRGSETVLVVEDDEMVRAVATRALRRAGYEVVETAGPGEALRAVEAGQRFDVLLTDVVMPEMSGPELADRVREARPSSRVLFMSGYTGAGLSQRRMLRGDAAFVEKPFTAEALLVAVRGVIARPSRI